MIIFIYTILAFLATIVGSITGMGGGVIMKPIMDMMGHYDSATIGILSSITVFSMAVVSCLRQIGKKPNVKIRNLVFLGVASAIGGLGGQFLFDFIRKVTNNNSLIMIIQNGVLCLILAVIFIYMLKKDKIKSLNLQHWIFYILSGILLGVISSFLGIGGGPINVAILVYLFNLDVKTATFGSIVTILFSQISKISTVAISTGFFTGFDLTVLPYLAGAAVIGAFVGSLISKRVNDRVIVILFNSAQVLIMGLCIANIIRYSIML